MRSQPGTLDRAAARAALGLGDDDFLVCSFGLLAVTKCNEKILEAWLNSSLATAKHCRLVFVGENHIGPFGNALSARMAGHANVKITGFVSQELFRTYLAAADCGVQLRSRSRGETSLTILDSLAYGLPTIINAHGSAVEIPDHVALKLPDQFTDAELSDAILRLRDEAGLAERLVADSAEYMRRVHHPAAVGAAYHAAIEDFARHSPRARYRQVIAALGEIHAVAEPDQRDWVQVAASLAANAPSRDLPQLLVDIGGAEDDPAARQRLLRLLAEPPPGYRVEPVRHEADGYRYARRYTLALIGRDDLALADAVAAVGPRDSLLALGEAAPAAAAALHNRGVTPFDAAEGSLHAA